MIKTTAYIPASRDHVYRALTTYASYPEWAPNCGSCNVLSSSGSTTNVEMVVTAPRRMCLAVRFEGEPGQTLRHELISGELKKYSGTYRLVQAADGQGTVMFAELDLEVASMPRFVTDGLAKKSLDQAAASLKRFVEKQLRAAQGPASAVVVPKAEPKRSRRVLQIVKEPKKYRVWFMGKTVAMEKIDGNVFDA